MSIDPDMLAAYADGELDPEAAAFVELALAADPTLAETIAAHRALRGQLHAHFAPILDRPVPPALAAALKSAPVVDLAAVRAAKAERGRRFGGWAMGGAIAASLVVGMLVVGRLPTRAPFGDKDGRIVAAGLLDRALTGQLASAKGDGPVRILLSFRAGDGRYCRGFEAAPTAGIACREGGDWTIVRSRSVNAKPPENANSPDYRQAGSTLAEIMAAAQDMAPEGGLDPAEERAARDRHWRD